VLLPGERHSKATVAAELNVWSPVVKSSSTS
jgi:hypothetical protein